MKPTGKRYTRAQIATVKAALEAGIPGPTIARHTGIGIQSIWNWGCGKVCKAVLPDPKVKLKIIEVLNGK